MSVGLAGGKPVPQRPSATRNAVLPAPDAKDIRLPPSEAPSKGAGSREAFVSDASKRIAARYEGNLSQLSRPQPATGQEHSDRFPIERDVHDVVNRQSQIVSHPTRSPIV